MEIASYLIKWVSLTFIIKSLKLILSDRVPFA